MNARVALARLPFALVLAALLTALLAMSSLARFLPFALAGSALLWLGLALLAALAPAVLARGSPLPAALAVAVPALAAASYGASRLDWLRLLKDFGVAETSALSPLRLALGLLALLVAWAMHATDLSLRLRGRSLARGATPEQARAASRVALVRGAQAGALALAGGLALVGVALVGALLAKVLPVERAAFVAPLVAALVLAAAGAYLAAGRGQANR